MAHTLPKYYTKTLKNNLRIVVIPMNNGSNVVSTNIFYNVGSRNEVMGKSGIAHMLEHLNFKSTKNLKSGEFDKIVKSFGGINNASTSFDYTKYFIKSSSKNMDKSLKLFAELMENLTLKNKEFQLERDVVAEERRWTTDNNPMGYLQYRLFNNAYIYHPYHWTPIGFTNDIKTWTINDIRDFHSTYYQPKNALIIVAGDITKDKVFKTAKKYFGKIENKKEIKTKVHMIEPKQDGAKIIGINKNTQVQMLAIGFHIPNYEHEDQVALSVLSDLLSTGKSSYLQKILVDEKRMVNSIYAYNLGLTDPSLFIFVAVCNAGVKANEVKEEIDKIIQSIKDGNIAKEEIEKVKINTKADFIFSLENSNSVASLYGDYFIRGNIKPLFEYEEKISKLKKKDIIDVANKYLTENNSTTLILK